MSAASTSCTAGLSSRSATRAAPSTATSTTTRERILRSGRPSTWLAASSNGYPATTNDNGTLFTGNIGTGKTHLAVGILQALVLEKSVPALFCDYREILKSIGNSYNPQVASTELEVLQPVFAAEVLVIDELGAAKPTEWVWDTVAHLINTHYNDKALLLVGYCGAFRRSELAALEVRDLTWSAQAARNGATAFDIMRQTGHKSIAIVSRYIREAELFRDSPASKLGL